MRRTPTTRRSSTPSSPSSARWCDGLAKAGCGYVHMDAPGFTAYVDPPSLERFRDRGEDPEAMLRATVARRERGHRGLRRRDVRHPPLPRQRAEPLAPRGQLRRHRRAAVRELRHDRLLLEYDTERAGGFEPLRFVRPGEIACSASSRRSPASSRTATSCCAASRRPRASCPLEQLAISPQCGFASGVEGNDLTRDEQWAQARPHAGGLPRRVGLGAQGFARSEAARAFAGQRPRPSAAPTPR